MNQPPENSVQPLSRPAWRRWLAAHEHRKQGVWLILNKKASQEPTLSTDDVVEEAIAFGWIDSVPRKLDDERYLLWIAPRQPVASREVADCRENIDLFAWGDEDSDAL